jgi:uncharacterized protein (DUF934 family)
MLERNWLIRIIDGRPIVVADDWRRVASGAEWPAGERLLIALRDALPRRGEFERRAVQGALGVWLAPDDEPADAVPLLPSVQLIAVDFPAFTDGRGYSTATLLRTRHGWRGELRAIGDVLRDQLRALRRVGFDSFALRAGRDPHAALAAFDEFSESYQGAVDQPLPWFRRRKEHA